MFLAQGRLLRRAIVPGRSAVKLCAPAAAWAQCSRKISGESKPPVRINGERLWDTLMIMGKIGGTEKGGCCRLALTDLDREARDLWIKWCEEEGCTIRVDKMGNVFAHRKGEDDSLAPVMTGSHIDTQPTGGKFDGVYGVMAGLEVIRTLNENNIKTKHPVEATIWTNEEGSRFAPAVPCHPTRHD